MQAVHLARRWWESVSGGDPDLADEQWLLNLLNPAEQRLFHHLSRPDRAHAVQSARRVRPPTAPAPVDTDELRVAAALHDVGKSVADLPTTTRVVATLLGMVAPSRARGRLADYLRHPQLGADLLSQAGSSDLVVTWAREHHLPPRQRTLPADLAAILAAAD